MDVVYAIGAGSNWADNELRYSLRSIERHFAQAGQVWVVGQKPGWLRGVRHVPCRDPYKANSDANIINKVMRVCLEDELTEEFVFVMDDNCLLRRCTVEDFRPYVLQDLGSVATWDHRLWAARLRRTFERLTLRCLPRLNFESHTPVVFGKRQFPRVFLEFDYGAAEGYTLYSTYFNSLRISGPSLEASGARAGFFVPERAGSLEEVRHACRGGTFLSYNDRGLTPALKEFLASEFPDPSVYEGKAGGEDGQSGETGGMTQPV